MNELIYNQCKIPKNQWRYGFRSSAATGCGWIATHNALLLMGHPSKPEEVIQYYKHCFPFINGITGTFLPNIIQFFKKNHFEVKVTGQRKKFDEISRNSDVCILFYFWHRKWKFGSHYVTVQYSDEKFWGYNTYSNSTGADYFGKSLEKYTKRRKFKGVILIAIQNK